MALEVSEMMVVIVTTTSECSEDLILERTLRAGARMNDVQAWYLQANTFRWRWGGGKTGWDWRSVR